MAMTVLTVLVVCVTVASLIGDATGAVNPNVVTSCFSCSIGDASCNDNQFVRTVSGLTSCQNGVCYVITATGPGGGKFNGRGCDTTYSNAGSTPCVNFNQGGYIGKQCYCVTDQCNSGTSPVASYVGLGTFLGIAFVAVVAAMASRAA